MLNLPSPGHYPMNGQTKWHGGHFLKCWSKLKILKLITLVVFLKRIGNLIAFLLNWLWLQHSITFSLQLLHLWIDHVITILILWWKLKIRINYIPYRTPAPSQPPTREFWRVSTSICRLSLLLVFLYHSQSSPSSRFFPAC